MTPLTAQQEKECLDYDPFAGDFGDQADRILQDRFNTSNKEYNAGSCSICFGVITKGERYRKQVARIDRELKVCRMCSKCCAVMAASWTDNGVAIEERTELGMYRAGYGFHITEDEFFAERLGRKTLNDRATELNDGSRTRAASERMADALEGLHSPTVTLFRPAWVLAAIVAFGIAVLVLRSIVMMHHG